MLPKIQTKLRHNNSDLVFNVEYTFTLSLPYVLLSKLRYACTHKNTPLPLHCYSTATPLPLHYHSTTTPLPLHYHSSSTRGGRVRTKQHQRKLVREGERTLGLRGGGGGGGTVRIVAHRRTTTPPQGPHHCHLRRVQDKPHRGPTTVILGRKGKGGEDGRRERMGKRQ